MRIKPVTHIQSQLRGMLRIAGLLTVIFLVSGIYQEAHATHIVGGDLTYRCLGNNLYEIRLTLRRDCFLGAEDAQFDDPASIGFFGADNNELLTFVGLNGQLLIPLNEDDTLNQTFISDCTIAGNDVCVHQTTYVDTILLPEYPGGYTMAYQRCCRNATLNNVVNPLNTGMTLTATLDHSAQLTCNSSPVLGPYAPIYICVGEPIDFLFEATDPDGDSLSFCLITPNGGGDKIANKPQPPPQPPYDTVNWVDPPYNLGNILGGTALQIDPVTGHMTGTPNTIGQFLVGVCISSYDPITGKLIETAVREWQYNVRMCRDVPEAAFTPIPELNCEDRTISFINSSTNSDEFLWIFDYPNPASATSNDTNPSYTYLQDGFYDVALIANDVDSICFDTAIITVGAFASQLVASFDLTVSKCTEDIFLEVEDTSSEPDSNFDIASWLWVLTYGSFSDTMTAQDPTFVIDTSFENVNLYLQVTSENGCTAEADETFDVNVIRVNFLADDTIFICDLDTTPLITNGDPDFTYMWSPEESLILSGDGSPSNPLAHPRETTTYSVTVSDGLCTIIDSIVVSVQDLPFLDFETYTDCKSLTVEITNNSDGIAYFWDFGDPNTDADTSNAVNPAYTYETAGVYTITLSSADGCTKDTTKEVTVSVIDEEIEDVTISCFLEPVILNPDGSDAYSYQWEPGDFLDNDTAISPLATVTGDITFYVTITDNLLPGCSIVDSVMVIVPPDFDLEAPNDTAYCNAPGILISGGNPDLQYIWLGPDGDTLGVGADILLSPLDTTSYIVIGVDTFGCSKQDSFTLAPTFFAITMSSDTTICQGDSIVIGIMNQEPNQELEFVWSPVESILSGATSATPLVKPDFNTVYTVDITNKTLGCTVQENIEVLVSVFDYEISTDQLICLGDEIQLVVNNIDTTNLCFDWNPKIGITGDTTNMPDVSPEESILYFVDITNKDYGCVTSDSVLVEVSWFDPPTCEVFLEQDTIFFTESVQLSTNQNGPGLQFSWTGPGLDDPNSPTPIATPPVSDVPIEYCATITNPDGCTFTCCVSLVVLDPACDMTDVFIPTAFSPNNDGANDILFVRGNFITTMELRIYNRWGEQVYVSKNQANGWDGTFRGEELAPDVYGYYLMVTCPPAKDYFIKGNVTLFR